MKSIINYIRYCYNQLMEKTLRKLWKTIPTVLVIAFLCTIGDFSFIKRLLMHVENVVEYQGETLDLSDIQNDYEILDLRTSNTKTFKKINDSYELVIYSEDVHYLADENYQEIDNSLVEEDVYYVNKANKFNVKFPKSLNDQVKSEIKYNNNVLQWKFNGANPSYANTLENENKVKYNNLFKNVNLEYIVTNNSVKENLELLKYIEDFSFSYTLYTDLRIEREGDKLKLYNYEHQLIYTINEYFMFDANKNMSYDIEYNVSHVKENEYLVTVIPNNDYLKNATYPVIIDPEIVINNMESVMGAIDVKLFEPTHPSYPYYYPAHYGLDYLTVNDLDYESSKLYMSIQFPSDSSYPGMSDLKNYNFLYSYVTLPNVESNCTSGECTVNARKVNTNGWNDVVPNGSFTVDSEVLASEKFHNNSTFTQRFDIYDYLYDNVNKFGTSFNLSLEFTLEGGYGSYVKYTKPYSYYDEISEFRIGYSNTAGLQDYYTYEELPSSNSSVAYIAHNSGNLTTVYNDYTDDNLINISHIYNSNRSHVLGNYGYGFGLNMEESIRTYSSSTLRLTKGDGSEVDYARKLDELGNQFYLATDGSGEKIYGSSGSYRLETKNNVEKLYNSSNKLYRIYPDTDDKTNYILISFDTSNRINKVNDNYGNEIVLNYYNNLLSSMSIYRMDENNTKVFYESRSYSYYLSKLQAIEKYEDKAMEVYEICDFQYYINTNKLYTIKDDLSNGLKFSYDKANRIDRVEQIIPNITITPYLSLIYDNNGRKLTLQDSNDLTVSYTFDKFFHTKTVTNSLGYTSFSEYYDIYYPGGVYTSDPNYNLNHKIKNSSQPYKNNVNLINNHSFELSPYLDYWTNESLNGGIAKIEQTSLYGAQALKLYKPTSSATALVSQTINVKQGQTYYISGYIKNVSETGNGAFIDIQLSTDITIKSRSDSIKGSSGYIYYSITFEANFDTSLDVELINDSIGEAYFDMIQVVQMEQEYINTKYNFLQNASFETPLNWTNLDSTEILVNNTNNSLFDNKLMGNYFVKFRGDTISQTVNIEGEAGDIFVYGGSAYMENVDANGTVTLTFYYKDDTTSDSSPYQYKYDSKDSNIQYLMYKAVALKPYSKVELKINNTSVNEYLYIDNMALYKEGYGVSFNYVDEGASNGNISEEYNEVTKSKTIYQYSLNSDNLEYVTEDNVSSDVKYVQGKDWVESITTNNISKNYKIDDQGNVTELSVYSTTDLVYNFSKSTNYTPDKLYIDSEMDEYGRVNDFTYDYITGLLTSSITNGITTNYSYDSLKNITSISKGTKTITYGYTGKMLTSITVDGLTYSFEYNDYKDIVAIKIAGSTVISNTYKDVNTSQYSGLVDQTVYGNNIISFTYDNEKRIKEVFVNNVRQIEYTYDSIGNIAKVVDYKSDPDITHYYNFDEQNRLINIKSSDGNDVSYYYDEDGFIDGKTNSNGYVDYIFAPIGTPTTGKNSNKIITDENFGIFNKKYNYLNQGLKKLDSTAIITGTSTITTDFTYDSFTKYVDNKSRIYETFRIKELNINSNINNHIKLVYSYDDYDNIDTINRYDNGVQTVYEDFDYDIYQQLIYHIQIIDNTEHYTYYEYDIRGNIISISKEEYGDNYTSSYTTFSYKPTGWKDLLTSVTIDGVTSYVGGYDSVGNPSYYLNWIDGLTFDNRNLTSLNDPWNSINFTYNSSGIRTSKKQNGVTIADYTLEGNKIIKEIRDYTDVRTGAVIDDSLKYYYDYNGDIIGFSYNETEYIYIKNLQNDIIAISDLNGNFIVKYFYDAYGNVISIKDSSGIGLGEKNPFRYKSYYYDIETKLYYLNSRYYDPSVGRFINADDISLLGYGEINLFVYCQNNPVLYKDTNGYRVSNTNLNMSDGGGSAAIELINSRTLVQKAENKNFFQDAVEWISDTVGVTASKGNETGVEAYRVVYSTEVGAGYSKSFETGKPVNLYVSTPDKFWQLWEYSIGIDVNIDGYGIGFYTGTEKGISIHNGNTSYDISMNLRGQTSLKKSILNSDGTYSYAKFSVNKYEAALAVIGVSYVYPYIVDGMNRIGPTPAFGN